MPQSSEEILSEEWLIEFLATIVDEDKLRASPVPDDPLLEMIQIRVVQDNMSMSEAISSAVNTVNEYVVAILDCLDFPPNAITHIELIKQIEKRGLKAKLPEVSAALSFLDGSQRIYMQDGWFAKLHPPLSIDITLVDLDLVFGTGRFAQ